MHQDGEEEEEEPVEWKLHWIVDMRLRGRA